MIPRAAIFLTYRVMLEVGVRAVQMFNKVQIRPLQSFWSLVNKWLLSLKCAKGGKGGKC
jgi:hypothetical protein